VQRPLSQISKDIEFFLSSFFFYKIREKEGRTGPAQGV
jgi:hypothetical protein